MPAYTPEAFIDGIMELQNIIKKGESKPTFNIAKKELESVSELKVKKHENFIDKDIVDQNLFVQTIKELKSKNFSYLIL